jgi:uncharacterized protein (TIGR00369 family)
LYADFEPEQTPDNLMPYPPKLEEEIGYLQELLGASAVFPPPCFVTMNAEFAAYESRSSLTVTFPVTENLLNPVGAMQGGFITAALDNVLGPLSYLAMKNPASTLDIHTQYIRAVSAGDTLTVTARVVSMGPATLVMTAEARNVRGKLVATATANAIAVGKGSRL